MTVLAKQYDKNSRFLRITLENNTESVKVDDSAVVIINAKRTDGQSKSFRGSVNHDGTVTVPITNWMMELDKPMTCDVSVIDGASEQKLTTMAFNLIVETAANPNDNVSEDKNYDVLVSLIADWDRAKGKCEEMIAAAAETAEKAGQAAESIYGSIDAASVAIDDANRAAREALSAADSVRSAIEAAETAKDNANSAASEAIEATRKANMANEAANDAVAEANSAIQKANGAVSAAYEAVQTVNDAAEAANAAKMDADEAAKSAVNAAQAANEATENVQKLFDSKQDKLSGTAGQLIGFDDNGNAVAMDVKSIPEISALETAVGILMGDNPSWDTVQKFVRLGLGPKYFPVGYEFTVHNSDYDYDMIWRVVAHDHHKAANEHLEHTMTLEMKNVLSDSSGTYVPVQYDAAETENFVELQNNDSRVSNGSNNYAQSAIDQFLNSDGEAGTYWTAQTVFDQAPSWNSTLKGFMHGLPEDFLAIVESAVIPCRTNSVFETDSLDGTEFTTAQIYELTRKFFLLSRPEVFGSWDNSSIKDGEVLEYYNGVTNSERIRRDENGSACHSWLRSPNANSADMIRRVSTDGTVANSGARYAYGVVAACIIA